VGQISYVPVLDRAVELIVALRWTVQHESIYRETSSVRVRFLLLPKEHPISGLYCTAFARAQTVSSLTPFEPDSCLPLIANVAFFSAPSHKYLRASRTSSFTFQFSTNLHSSTYLERPAPFSFLYYIKLNATRSCQASMSSLTWLKRIPWLPIQPPPMPRQRKAPVRRAVAYQTDHPKRPGPICRTKTSASPSNLCHQPLI